MFIAAAVLMAAADASPSAPGGPAAPAKAKEKVEMVCWEEMPTGSHMAKRFCAPKAQVDQQQRQAQDAIANSANRAPGSGLSAGRPR